MNKTDRNSLIALPIVILIGLGVVLAGSQGGASVFGIPLFAFSVGLAFLIQWLVFVPAYLLQTEKFFDLTGSITYISVTIIAVLLSPVFDGRSVLLLAMVVIWAARLGTFLFRRIQEAGKDARFDEIKPSFIRFLSTWTLQGLWVTFTLAAALAAITTTTRKELDLFALIGCPDHHHGQQEDRPTGLVTPITSVRSCSGSVWRSSPCRSCGAGSGSPWFLRSLLPCCSPASAACQC